ncbi:MAG: hypothetical protein ACK5T0_07490 [Vampirovibrionales bacterium]
MIYNTAYANPYQTGVNPYQTGYSSYPTPAYGQPQQTRMAFPVVNYNSRTLITKNTFYNYGGTIYNNSRPPYYPNTPYAYAQQPRQPLSDLISPPPRSVWGPTSRKEKTEGFPAGFGDLAGDPRFASVYNRPAPAKLQKAVTPKPTPKPAPTPRKLVAANEHSSYWGDPHVADADRSDKGNKRQDNFVVKGDGIFNLLTDRNISLNAQHKKYDQFAIEVTDQIGLRIPNANITFSAYGTPQLNGKALEVGKETTLPDQSKIKWDGTTLTVTSSDSSEYNVSINIVDAGHKNPDGSAIKYLDTDLSTKGKGVNSDGVMPSGILGEGFDEDNEARSALKKDLSTYKRNSLLG